RIEGGNRAYFVKLNRSGLVDMFEAETEGLREIPATATVRVPEPIAEIRKNRRPFSSNRNVPGLG
ncbi:MAG: fructosamine kinase family protein, partial [Methylococcales bacterium]